MAFTKASFGGNVGGGPANKLFVYSTNDTKETAIASGYFDDIADILTVGDTIILAFDLDGTHGTAILRIAGISSGVVTTGYAVIA